MALAPRSVGAASVTDAGRCLAGSLGAARLPTRRRAAMAPLSDVRRPAAAGVRKSSITLFGAEVLAGFQAPPLRPVGLDFASKAGAMPRRPHRLRPTIPASKKWAKRLSRHHPSRLSRSRHTFPRAASRRVSDGPAARYTATPRDAVLRRVEPPHGSESRLARLSPPGPSAASVGWIRR